MNPIDIQGMRNLLNVWRSKQDGDFEDAVRLLDQSEVLGKPFGKELTLQVLDYTDGEWIPCVAPGGRTMSNLNDWYSFIRNDLEWTGPVRLAVAAKP